MLAPDRDKGKRQISATPLTFCSLGGRWRRQDGTQRGLFRRQEGWSPEIEPLSCCRELQTSGPPFFGGRPTCVSESITVRRLPLTLRPDSSRVLVRPFFPTDRRNGNESDRLAARSHDSCADSRLVRRTGQRVAGEVFKNLEIAIKGSRTSWRSGSRRCRNICLPT